MRVHREPEDWPIRPVATRRYATKGCWSCVDAWAGRLGLAGPAAITQASEVPGAG
jgi:hypothetical protein